MGHYIIRVFDRMITRGEHSKPMLANRAIRSRLIAATAVGRMVDPNEELLRLVADLNE